MKIEMWFGFTLLCLLSLGAESKPVLVAVAANFTKPMKNLIEEFEETSGYAIVMSSGSSGKFYAQISQGAPYDLFFSADQVKPLGLDRKGLAVAGSRFTYAVGRLALWSARADFAGEVKDRLQEGTFNKIALANTKLAPYGSAAIETLNYLNLLNATRAKWVTGENIAQTYQFVSTTNADLGFVALSQLLSQNSLARESYWIVPQVMHQPINQDVVLLNRAAENPGAQAFLLFTRSAKAQNIIAKFGYSTPIRGKEI